MNLDVIEHEAALQKLAIEIADDCARADIECFCTGDPREGWNIAVDDENADIVERALLYLDLRGDALPYQVQREGNLMRFRNKP